MFYDPHCKPQVKLEPWRELLLRAADIMERRGHCRGDYEDADGRVCLQGALRVAHQGHAKWLPSVSNTPIRNAAHALSLSLGSPSFIWNDEPGRTQAEAVAALRGAARI